MTELGISLLAIGAICVVLEAHISSLGILGGPGVIALAAGAVLAITGLGAGLAVGVLGALLLSLTAASVLAITFHKGVGVRRRRIRTGAEGLIGRVGVVRSWSEPTGSVLVDGALWRACRSDVGDHELSDKTDELHAGDSVVVEYLSGLTLSVRRADEWELVR
jgi:membrane-bound serine protease (ClpP class)